MVYLDYCHLKSPREQETYPTVVLREGETLVIFALMLPHRRRELEWPAKRMAESIRSMGLERVVVRADRENAMLAFLENIRRQGIQILVEKSPRYEKQSNSRGDKLLKLPRGSSAR